MIVEGIAVEFDKYIFDAFYTKDHQWPPEVVLYSKDNGLPLSYVEQEGLDYLVLEYKATDGWERRQLKEEDMIMIVPRYIIDIFDNLKIIEGVPITNYSV